MSGIAVGVGVAGVAAGLAGSYLSAQGAKNATRAQIRAAEKNREYERRNLLRNKAGTLAAILGPQRAYKLLAGSLGADELRGLFRDPEVAKKKDGLVKRRKELEDTLAKYYGGERLGQRIYRSKDAAADGVNVSALARELRDINGEIKGITDNVGGINAGAFDDMGPGTLAAYEDMAKMADKQGADTLAQFEGDTRTVMDQSRGIEEGLNQYGDQERRRIDRDYDRAATSSSRLIESRLLSRGMGGSTVLANQLSGNAARLEEGRRDAQGQLSDRTISMQTAARGQRVGMLNSRLGARTQLRMAADDRGMGYRNQALNLETSLLTGGINNPQFEQPYTVGLSPSAAGAATWGAGLGAVGGTLMGAAGQYAMNNYAGRQGQEPNLPPLRPSAHDGPYVPNR